jgi:hypothetical protein
VRPIPLKIRSAQTPTSIADTPALQTIALHFVESLQPVSAAAQVLARALNFSLDRATQIGIPSVAIPAGNFVAEGRAIPVVQGLTSPAMLDPHKVGVIVVLTNEMMHNSQAEAILRQTMIEATAAAFDGLMFSAAPGVANERPAGLLYNVAPIAPSSASSPLDAMIADLQQIAKATAPVSGASAPVLIAAPAQAVSLAMLAVRDVWPVFASAALPDRTIIGLVPGAVAVAIDRLRLEAGNQMAANMEDTPGEIVDIGGVFARTVGSVFQTDSVGLRLIMPCSWGLRSASAIAWLESVNW